MSDHFKVYRVADAPQWMCDFGKLCRDDDAIVVVEKPASAFIDGMARSVASAALGYVIARGAPLAADFGNTGSGINRHETDTHIIYTVDRT